MERLIPPVEYTLEIIEQIEIIKNRMRQTLVDFDDDTIKVFEYDNFVYILANPYLGTESVLDKYGNWQQIPLYNFTITKPKDWIDFKDGKFVVKIPDLRIMRPDLCARLEPDKCLK